VLTPGVPFTQEEHIMPLDFTVEDHVATLTLNRPEAMNSIDPEMRSALHAAWKRIKEDDGIRVAILTGAGGTQRLPRAVGLSNAMLMLLTGDRVDAAEALRIGLVSKVVPNQELLPAAREIAQRIARNAPLSVRAIKRLVHDGMDMPLRTALDNERYVFGLLRDTEDRIEGRLAFQEKRPPAYKGR
jgi:enoyl-CoA hydratase/carnithine racemase